MTATYPMSGTSTQISGTSRWERVEIEAVERKFEKLLASYVALLAFAEANSSFVDDVGTLVINPHIEKAHETLRAVTMLS